MKLLTLFIGVACYASIKAIWVFCRLSMSALFEFLFIFCLCNTATSIFRMSCKGLNSQISCSLQLFSASIQTAKAFSNVSQTESLSSFSESASVNASVTVSGPSYASKSELASHNVTASLSQDVSVISSALQSQSSAPPSSSNVSAISTSASEDGPSSASYLKSISPSVSQNISASKSESVIFPSLVNKWIGFPEYNKPLQYT